MFWFILAAALLILELFIGTIYLMVVSTALFGAGLVAWLTANTVAAILTAAVLSALGIWWARDWIQKHRKPEDIENLANDLDIGQAVQISRHLHTDYYEVVYRGTHWQAQAVNTLSATAAHTGVITGKNGNILLIHLN
ncbi:NfeD family protein [Neisseria iguanae]|uniref:Nodulation efficiency NfeD family protein n=1 Tax=Neisseria iguanae TaxID=90242 RepID=A0A2P7TY24_9NEIS|nr:NfeD family protein [Neisseria iguanae]PSJ79629.1 nodulation efficiency NfeD family protein [Neisseria iguanae]